MIGERVVLLGVEHLEQRRRRVAAEVVTDLVDLVHHEDGVDGRRLLHALDDLPGERADVRAPVTADRRLVVHAAERDAVELAPERPRDAAAERRLADAGRPDEAEDRPLLVLLQLADGEVLEDALLHLLEAVVVLVEDLADRRDVHVVGRLRRATADRGSSRGRCGRRCTRREPTCMLRRRLSCFFATCSASVGRFAFAMRSSRPSRSPWSPSSSPELLLDRLELLAKDVLALVLAHLLFDLGVDALAHLEDLELPREELAAPCGCAPSRRPSRGAAGLLFDRARRGSPRRGRRARRAPGSSR